MTPSVKIPDEVYNLFVSPLILRKQRMSALVKWFMNNYYRWQESELGECAAVVTMSNPEFANALTKSIKSYPITIQAQRVWTWISERNLPRPDNFQVMAKDAEGWQREFARIVLLILESGEPE